MRGAPSPSRSPPPGQVSALSPVCIKAALKPEETREIRELRLNPFAASSGVVTKPSPRCRERDVLPRERSPDKTIQVHLRNFCLLLAMAAVPSAGSLLAKNQYYRTRLNSESSVSSSSSSCCSDPMNCSDQEKTFHGLPEVFEKWWWIKSFFHCESAPQNLGRKTLSASSANS